MMLSILTQYSNLLIGILLIELLIILGFGIMEYIGEAGD